MWIPPEEADPVVLHAPTRRQTAVFGAVCVADGRLAVMNAETFNALSFQKFLEGLLRRKKHGRKMVVVLDNARWHHARLVRPWLRKHRHAIKLEFLPPYSPDLNPIERVWKLVRRLCTHNRYFKNLEELVGVIRKQLEKWFEPNGQLKRLCAIV
jgi:transposase